MSWLKYRHNEAAGRGSWEWRDIGELEFGSAALLEIIYELEAVYQEHDKYRGVEIGGLVALPPRWVIESELALAVERFTSLERRVVRLDAALKDAVPCPTCDDHRYPCANCGGPK